MLLKKSPVLNAFLKITAVAALSVIGASSASADIISDRFSAVTAAEQAFRQQPDNSDIQFKLGRAYLMAGRYLSAWQCLNKLVLRDPYNEKARLYMGLAAIGSNNKTAAQSILSPITKVSPVDLGLALTLAGQPTEAIKRMEPLLSTPSNSARLRQNLAFAYAMAERWNDASKMAGQDLSADQVNARLSQWSRVIREKNGAVQLQAFIGVPPAKDYGFLSSAPASIPVVQTPSPVIPPKADSPAPRPTVSPAIMPASSSAPVAPSISQPTKTAAIANPIPVPAKPATPAPTALSNDQNGQHMATATSATTAPATRPAATLTAATNPNAPSTITEIELPSANSKQPTPRASSNPTISDSDRISDNAPKTPTVTVKEKIASQQTAPSPKKSLNLPIKEILAENKSTKATATTAPNSPEKKESLSQNTAALKADSKKEDKDCSSATCHNVTYPAIQLATHKLPITPAATEQSHKILQSIQAKLPNAAKYKIITYSETGSPVYRLLVTGFASAKEAQESCNSLMKKEIACMASSYKESVPTTKSVKKTK